MHDAYKKMMDQQHLSPHAQTDFLEKLDSAAPKGIPYKKLLIIAACLCLLIPCVAFAAENIFDVASTKISEYPDASGELVPSFEIDFETVKEFPLEEIAEKWRYIEESHFVGYETWEESQQDMGIDLLDNTVLDASTPIKSIAYDFPQTNGKGPFHCGNRYHSLDGQLCAISNEVSYNVEGTHVNVTTEFLVEHPTVPQEFKDIITALIFIDDRNSTVSTDDFEAERYTSPSGLTATLVYPDSEAPALAVFRANGIRYMIWIMRSRYTDPSMSKQLLVKILDGFVVS